MEWDLNGSGGDELLDNLDPYFVAHVSFTWSTNRTDRIYIELLLCLTLLGFYNNGLCSFPRFVDF